MFGWLNMLILIIDMENVDLEKDNLIVKSLTSEDFDETLTNGIVEALEVEPGFSKCRRSVNKKPYIINNISINHQISYKKDPVGNAWYCFSLF